MGGNDTGEGDNGEMQRLVGSLQPKGTSLSGGGVLGWGLKVVMWGVNWRGTNLETAGSVFRLFLSPGKKMKV